MPILSTIEYFDWDPDTLEASLGVLTNQENRVLVNLTTASSAGPVVVDKVGHALFMWSALDSLFVIE